MTGWVSSAMRTTQNSPLAPPLAPADLPSQRGAQLPGGLAAPVLALPWKTFVKTTKSFTTEQMPLQPVLLEMNEEEEEASHSFPGHTAAPPAKPQAQPQGSAQDGGFPTRVSSLLRPPRLLSVVAAGGVRRRCDFIAF